MPHKAVDVHFFDSHELFKREYLLCLFKRANTFFENMHDNNKKIKNCHFSTMPKFQSFMSD